MKRQDVIHFLEFRKKFTKWEWFELNRLVDLSFKEKADKLKLDDSDIEKIMTMLPKTIQ